MQQKKQKVHKAVTVARIVAKQKVRKAVTVVHTVAKHKEENYYREKRPRKERQRKEHMPVTLAHDAAKKERQAKH